MADNVQKTPYGISQNRFARATAGAAIQLTGKSLPCSVVKAVKSGIVQVKFEIQDPVFTNLPNVTIPVLGVEYIRVPYQPGTKGFVISADAFLGGMSGLGGGVANLSPRANLTNLVFAPIGQTGWTTVDGQVLVMYGPNGVTLRDINSGSVMNITPTEIDATTTTFKITGDLHVTGAIIAGYGGADQVGVQTHLHSGVTVGTADTQAPVAGT